MNETTKIDTYSPERALLERLPHDQLVDLLIRTESERQRLSNHYEFALTDIKHLREKCSKAQERADIQALRDKLTGPDQ